MSIRLARAVRSRVQRASRSFSFIQRASRSRKVSSNTPGLSNWVVSDNCALISRVTVGRSRPIAAASGAAASGCISCRLASAASAWVTTSASGIGVDCAASVGAGETAAVGEGDS